MLNLAFEGWYQCRLATDPDPTDEPRGLTGPTFASPGEPDLDRIIRLQNPVAIRAPRDADFGVTVRDVSLSAAPPGPGVETRLLRDHPMIGAAVDFVNEPMYHQRNYIIVEGLNSPIDPLVVEVTQGDTKLRRVDEWDETRPGLTIDDVYLDPSLVSHRRQTIEVKSAELVEATGITDYIQYWVDRRAYLIALRDVTEDPTALAALDRRIAGIDETGVDAGTRVDARQFLGLKSTYQIDINGRASVEDPGRLLGGAVGTSQVWPITFWMGSYDVDTLCGYLRGTLSLPFHPEDEVS